MRRGEIFWGSLLVLLGVLFFLNAAGYLAGDIFGWFWPFFIIALGVWILLGGFISRTGFEKAEKFSIPTQGAKKASLSIENGASRIDLRAGASASDFLTGMVGAGMNRSAHLNGENLEVKISAGPSYIPFIGPEGGIWQFRVNPDMPTSIKIEAGASRFDLDLSDLCVTYFSFEGGASTLNLSLPAHMESTLAEIEAGAASINIKIPVDVALRFRTKSVGSLKIDETRFPLRDGGIYQSADFETAKYHAEVKVDGGATSITVV